MSAISFEVGNIASTTESVARSRTWIAGCQFLLLAILFSSPLAFGAVLPAAWGAIAIGTAVAVLFWAAACVQQRHVFLNYSRLLLVVVAVLFVAALQLVTHVTADAVGTREALVKVASDGILLFLTSTLFASVSESSLRRFGWLISAYSFAIALFAIVQAFASPDRIYWAITPRWGGYIFGPYVNHNHYAGLMEMLFPLTLAFLLSVRTEGIIRFWFAFAAMIVMASVILSGSRAGVISLALQMGAFGGFLYIKKHLPARRIVVTLLVTAISAGLLYSWLSSEFLATRFQVALQHPEASYGERRSMASDALVITRHFPLTGTGLGSFSTVYPQYQSFATDRQVEHAHNDYAEFLAETGIPGAVILIVALVLLGARVHHNLQQPVVTTADWMRIGATISCLGIMFHSFVDFNLHIPANAAWFAVCLGIATTTAATEPLAN